MKKTLTGFHMDGLIALLLFGIFAVSLLAVLLTGAGAYKRLTGRDEEAYVRRTCVQYIANRVHQAPSGADVTVEPFGEGEALVVRDGTGYITRVYCYDGYLMELFTAADTLLLPESGKKILEMGELSLSLEDGLLYVIAVDQGGKSVDMLLSLTDGKEERWNEE